MRNLAILAFAALAILIGAASNAVAIQPVLSVPEPSSLAVLAAGVGVAAVVKFWKRK